MATENWDLQAFIFGCADLDDKEKNLCYDALDGEGFSAAIKRKAFFALDDADLRSVGITRLSTRKVLLLAITERAQGGAVASCQPGPGAAGGGAGVHASGQYAEHQQRDRQQQLQEQQGAAAQLLACSNVLRLVDAGETVGSCCLVSFHGRKFMLASRHCINPKPGQRIDVTSFAVCGHRLRHLASFPKHGVTVLLLDDGTELPDVLRNAIPFEVDGGIGLMPGIPVTLIGFPLAADKTIKGFQQSGIPLVAAGRVCWLSEEADEAIGSYSGAFPNCSGGAVAYGPPFRYLAGMHVGIMRHEQGTNPRDIATAAGQDDASGSGSGSGAPAAATAVASSGELVVETDTWSADAGATGLAGQASACGGSRKRKLASRLEGVARDCDVQHCLDNVVHKSCMGTFVPARVLVRLLRRCHGLLGCSS